MDTIRDVVQAVELDIVGTNQARQYITELVRRQLTNPAASRDTVGDVVKAFQLDLLDKTLAQKYAYELINNNLKANEIGDTPVNFGNNEPPKQTPATSSDDAEFQVMQIKDVAAQAFLTTDDPTTPTTALSASTSSSQATPTSSAGPSGLSTAGLEDSQLQQPGFQVAGLGGLQGVGLESSNALFGAQGPQSQQPEISSEELLDMENIDSGNSQPQSMSGGGGGGGGGGFSFGLGDKPIENVTANPFGSTLGAPKAPTGPSNIKLGWGGGILRPPTGSFDGGLSTAGLKDSQQPGGLQGAGLGSSKGLFGAQGQSFGSPPSFGAKLTFGSTPSFGGPPMFPPTLMFGGQGSGLGGDIFTSKAPGMPSFGSLAQPQGVGFRGAQSTGTPNQQSPQFSQRM